MPDEVRTQFMDCITNIPFVKHMIGTERKRACELPRDSEGKIIIDITQPHILEGMDYFRPAAKFYEENGCYTLLKPNKAKGSEFQKWFKEEKRRCLEGYVRESDGEWVTGYMYFYLNYAIIKLNRQSERTGVWHQVESLPDFWEGVYYGFHAAHQARMRGLHLIELARRGASKSYRIASMLTHNLLLGEDADSVRAVNSILTAYLKEYLGDKDGTLSKFDIMRTFLAQTTEFKRTMLRASPSDMSWRQGYKDASGIIHSNDNIVVGLSIKDDMRKIRGKRGMIFFEEMGAFPGLRDVYSNVMDSVKDGDNVFSFLYLVGCVCAGTRVWTSDGRYLPIEELKKEDGIVGFANDAIEVDDIECLTAPSVKDCVRIELCDHTYLECSTDHPIYVQHKKQKMRPNGSTSEVYYTYEFIPAGDLSVGDRVCEWRQVSVFGNDTLFDARFVGMMIGDGTYGYNNTPKYSSEDAELLNYVESHYDTGLSATHTTKKGNLYKDIRVKGICSKLREIGIYGQVKDAKRLPINYQTLTEHDTCELLSGLYDTDGTFSAKNQQIEITQCNREILEQIQVLLRKIGVISTIVKYEPRLSAGRKDRRPYWRLTTAGRFNIMAFYEHIHLLVPHKQKALDDMYSYSVAFVSKRPFKFDARKYIVSKIRSIIDIGKKPVYNMTVSGSHTYLANNIITHNTAGDKDSDFSGAKTLLYNPDKFGLIAFDNVWDFPGKGTDKFGFFFPAYISRSGCMDKDGNSDVTKAIRNILMERWTVKQSGDMDAYLKRVAETCITPAEAILKVKHSYFPVNELNERIRQLDVDHHAYDDVYVGTLMETPQGVIFKATDDTPIRTYPVNNDAPGALEIFEMPVLGREGKPMQNRYILGADPADNDSAESSSLYSIFVLDLLTDKIVAEYTGRRPYADQNHQMAYLLCKYYNGTLMYEANRKGLYSYFAKKHATWMLADCPEYLRAKSLIKYSPFGSAQKGISVNAGVNSFADELIDSWLKKAYIIDVKDDHGEKHQEEIPMLYTLRNRALLEELVAYEPDLRKKNVDRIRALSQVMLYREQFIILYGGVDAYMDETPSTAEDEFFDRDWNEHQSKQNRNAWRSIGDFIGQNSK